MDYQDLQSRVAEMLGLPDDDTEYLTKIKAWINESYKAISGLDQWPWLLKNDVIQTVVEINTGTVDVTNGSTSITFSSAPTPSVQDDWRIQFAETDDWYDISAHTAGATGATLADKFLGTTNATSKYTLRKVYYSLPSDFGKMMSVRQAITDVKLQPVDLRIWDDQIPDPTRVASPVWYLIIGQDSSQNYRITFHPIPDDEINIDIRYYQTVSDLSANDDEPLLPDQFRPILVFDVLSKYGYLFLDDDRIQTASALRDKFMKDLKGHGWPTPDHTVKKVPWDWSAWRSRGFGRGYYSRMPFDLPIQNP
jgi:hypothetical protein